MKRAQLLAMSKNPMFTMETSRPVRSSVKDSDIVVEPIGSGVLRIPLMPALRTSDLRRRDMMRKRAHLCCALR